MEGLRPGLEAGAVWRRETEGVKGMAGWPPPAVGQELGPFLSARRPSGRRRASRRTAMEGEPLGAPVMVRTAVSWARLESQTPAP